MNLVTCHVMHQLPQVQRTAANEALQLRLACVNHARISKNSAFGMSKNRKGITIMSCLHFQGFQVDLVCQHNLQKESSGPYQRKPCSVCIAGFSPVTQGRALRGCPTHF